MPSLIDFISHEVPYKFCISCGHLNGNYDETQDFLNTLYMSDSVGEYSSDYIDENFKYRTESIYLPKVDFLIEASLGNKFSVLDVGCGSGYFVYACYLRGISATGIDVSKQMIDFGNNQIYCQNRLTPLTQINESEFYKCIVETDVTVISAIGVIEHLKNPHNLFEAFEKSNAKLLYFSVPMFSASVVFENIFQNIYPRQLSGAHTHLFTEQSIYELLKIHKLSSIAEWRFGSDIMDLYRSILINLSKNKCSNELISRFESGFASKIDSMQTALDQNNFCSEIHCLVKK